jgi:hypothetical protein
MLTSSLNPDAFTESAVCATVECFLPARRLNKNAVLNIVINQVADIWKKVNADVGSAGRAVLSSIQAT